MDAFAVCWPLEFPSEEFLKKFPFCYQNLPVDFFYACSDFGTDIYGVWL